MKEEHSFQHVACFACDDTGRLFGVSERQPGSTNASVILVSRIQQRILAASKTQESHAPTLDLSKPEVSVELRTSPPIRFSVSSIVAASSGHQLLLVGAADEDADVPVLALVDVYAAHPESSSAAGTGGPERRLAMLQYVNQSLHSNRPGLSILQASWHPHSPSHFAALTSDSRLRLYNLEDLATPEQTFHLRLTTPGQQAASTLGLGLAAIGRQGARPVAFAWGPPVGWGKVAVLVLGSNGALFSLCPVAPFGARVTAGTLRSLMASAPSGTPRAWLQAAFVGAVLPSGTGLPEREGFVVQPHMLETYVPALLGPLNASVDSLRLRHGRAVAVSLALSSYEGLRQHQSSQPGDNSERSGRHEGSSRGGRGDEGSDDDESSIGGGVGMRAADRGEPVQCSALLTAFRDGNVYAHALDDAAIRGVWAEGAPQCSYNHRGDIYAVRMECEVLPLSQTQGMTQEPGSNDDDADSEYGGTASPLLLLDCIDLRLTTTPSTAGRPPGSWGDQDFADWDEDGEEVTQQQEGQGPVELLRRVKLHACPNAPGRFWAVHDRGAWALNVQWLRRMAHLLASEAVLSDGGLAEAGLLGELQPPVLQELLVSERGLVCSDAVESPLLGSGCVVLEAGGKLLYLRQGLQPLNAAAMRSRLLQAASTAGADGAAAAGPAAGGPGAAEGVRLGLSLEQRADIEEELQQAYGDLLVGPRNLPLPAHPSEQALGSDTPEGMARLNEAIAVLHEKHVVYAHKAHLDLVTRAADLQAEVLNHQQAVTELQELTNKAEERQKACQARLQRLHDIHANLDERLRLLAALHWSLPRPVSKAERELAREVDVWEGRARELRLAWSALAQRAGTVVESAKRASGGVHHGKGATSGRLPAVQLPRIHDALAEQATLINDSMQKLVLVTEELETWREEHPEAQLPKQLADMAMASDTLSGM